MVCHHIWQAESHSEDAWPEGHTSRLGFGVVPTQLSALHEFALSLNEVSQVRNSYNVLRLLVHIDEPQLTILPFGGQIDAHQHSETKTIQVGHVFQVQHQALCLRK